MVDLIMMKFVSSFYQEVYPQKLEVVVIINITNIINIIMNIIIKANPITIK